MRPPPRNVQQHCAVGHNMLELQHRRLQQICSLLPEATNNSHRPLQMLPSSNSCTAVFAGGQQQTPMSGGNSCAQLLQPQQQQRGRLEATNMVARGVANSCSMSRRNDRNPSPVGSSRSADAVRSSGRTSLFAETVSSRQKLAERRPHSAGSRLAVRSGSRGEVSVAAQTTPRSMVHTPRGTTPVHTPRGGLSANCSAGGSSSSNSTSRLPAAQLGRVVRARRPGAKEIEPSKPINSRWQGQVVVRAPTAQVPALAGPAPTVVALPSVAGLLASGPQASPRSHVGTASQSTSTSSRPSSPVVATSAVGRATSPASMTSAAASPAGGPGCSNSSPATGFKAVVAVADGAQAVPTVRPPGQGASMRQCVVAKLDFGGPSWPHQPPERLAAEDSSQAWIEPACLLPSQSPLSPIREVAESGHTPAPAVHAAGEGDAIAGTDASPSNAAETGSPTEANARLDHLASCAARIQGIGGGVRARVLGDAHGWPLQESNAERPVQSSKEKYWQIRERFLSK